MPKKLTRRKLITNTSKGLMGLAGLNFLSLASAQNPSSIKGAWAPELKVPHWIDSKGEKSEPFSILSNRGKWIYIKCFQEWCPACHSVGFPNLQKLVNAFPNNDKLATIAIQTTFEGYGYNTPVAMRKNQLKYELEIPFGHDPGNEDLPDDDPKHYPSTMLNYQTRGTPWVTVVHPDGRVVFSNFHINMDEFIKYLKQQGV